jgi:hypothetical protein
VIYFVQPVEGGPIKIGYSEDVSRRLPELRRSYDRELSLLHTIEGDLDSEIQIHERFSYLRIGRTEQFRPGADLLEFIGQDGFQSEEVEPMKLAKGYVFLKVPRDVYLNLKLLSTLTGREMALIVGDILRDPLVKMVDDAYKKSRAPK